MKPESSTNYKKIVDAVLDQINHGQLQKGDKLPTELCLTTKFDVSRTCVREAIKSLEAMGIVQSIQGSGSYITNTPELSINRPICALFALSNGTLENVLDLRIVLETDVCRDIIRNATDAEIARVPWPTTITSARRLTSSPCWTLSFTMRSCTRHTTPSSSTSTPRCPRSWTSTASVCSRKPGDWMKTR